MGKHTEEKVVILLASSSQNRTHSYSNTINEVTTNTTLYTSQDGLDTIFKVDNAPPHILIVEQGLAKLSGFDITTKLLHNKRYNKLAIIIISDLPDEEQFVDELVTGQVQFLTDPSNKEKFHASIRKALNFISLGEEAGYRLLFLNPHDVLFNEGEKGDSAYIVKKGELEAIKSSKILGKVQAGEFVGEMSHFNGEPRSATVRALSSAELIQIPFGSLDVILFRKPAWSKALVMTLTKRLKSSLPPKVN